MAVLYWSTLHLGRAVAILDWNRDGRVDLAVTDLKDDFALLENRTESDHHWLQLQLVGTTAERDAIGATIEVSFGGRAAMGSSRRYRRMSAARSAADWYRRPRSF